MKPFTANILFSLAATSFVLSLSSILYSCSTSSTNSSLQERVTKVEKISKDAFTEARKALSESDENNKTINGLSEGLATNSDNVTKVDTKAKDALKNAESALNKIKEAQRSIANVSKKLDAVAQDRWVEVPSDKTDKVKVYWLAKCDNGKSKKLPKSEVPNIDDAKIKLREMCSQ